MIARSLGRLSLTLVLALAVSCGKDKGNNPVTPTDLVLQPVVTSGLSWPVYLTSPPGDVNRQFVVEREGRIRIIKNGTLLGTPFLDITGIVTSTDYEQGLLGLAFDPAYATSGRFFVFYTDLNGDEVIARYLVSAGDADVANASADIIVITNPDPAIEHNGGMLAFGPDGMLWASIGDGGGAGDPYDNGQDPTDLMGSLLRIDVRGAGAYTIPSGNPYSGPDAPEIWNIGLRNPWRFSFDRATGDLYIADVGQGEHEEVDVATAPLRGRGANYGWPTMEGVNCFSPSSGCNTAGLTLPVLTYDHTEGCAITGGFVYRGSIPGLAGTYFYGDYCSGWVRSFRYRAGQATEAREWPNLDTGSHVLSFGEDASGELYVLTEAGAVLKIVTPPA